MARHSAADKRAKTSQQPATDVQTTVFLAQALEKTVDRKQRFDVDIPQNVPGAETPRIPQMDKDQAIREKQTNSLYLELPPLPTEPKPLPGPEGQPYTLARLQQIAAGNSPQLRQAAADVEAARGNLIQARAYPNPTVSYQVQPSNDGSTPGVLGFGIDQSISMGGKIKEQTAAAQKALDNAELALKRARSDLSTGCVMPISISSSLRKPCASTAPWPASRMMSTAFKLV